MLISIEFLVVCVVYASVLLSPLERRQLAGGAAGQGGAGAGEEAVKAVAAAHLV